MLLLNWRTFKDSQDVLQGCEQEKLDPSLLLLHIHSQYCSVMSDIFWLSIYEKYYTARDGLTSILCSDVVIRSNLSCSSLKRCNFSHNIWANFSGLLWATLLSVGTRSVRWTATWKQSVHYPHSKNTLLTNENEINF